VSISATTTTPAEGGITTFAITATTLSGAPPIQSVVVNYGDGSSDDLGSVSVTTPITVQHIYGDAGSYTPTVTATDTSGTTASASTVIIVQPIIVSITATPGTLDPQTFTFTANVSPPAGTASGITVASYTWNFGEGDPQTTSTNPTVHTYKTTGSKPVRVTVRTSTSKTASGSTTVQVP
jgi:PKD repeat protein